jgi:HlyD family secretion protein
MKIKTLITLLILITIAGCGKDEKKEVLEGKVKRETISLAPKVPGRILEIRVNEGDIVKAGDTLAVLDVPEVKAKLMQAQGALMAATNQHLMAVNGATKEQREQVEAAYKAALEQFQFAEKSMKRIKGMYADSLVSSQMYDETLAKYNAAKAQLDGVTAKKNEVYGKVRSEQVGMAAGQMQQAGGAVQEATVALSERYVIAPKNMTIETIALHVGELALPGYNLIVGYNVDEMYFRFTVAESKVANFKNGNEYDVILPFDKEKLVKVKLKAIRQMARYANKTSAYPSYQLGESVYELKMEPVDPKSIENLFNNATVILNNY